MIVMSKTIIAPIVAVIALAIQLIFDVKIPDEVLNEVVMAIGNVALVVASLVGIFKNHKKDETK